MSALPKVLPDDRCSREVPRGGVGSFGWADGASERRADVEVGVAAGLLGTPWDGHGPGRPAEATESADKSEHVVQAAARALSAGGGGTKPLGAAAKMAAWKQLVGCAPRRRSNRVPQVLPQRAWSSRTQGRGHRGERGGGRDRAPRTRPRGRPRGTLPPRTRPRESRAGPPWSRGREPPAIADPKAG